SFDVAERYEEDNWFIEFTAPGYSGFYDGPLSIDFYGFNDHTVKTLEIPFTVHAIKPGTALRIKVELLGGPNGPIDREVDFAISNSLGSVGLGSAMVPFTNRVIYTSPGAASDALVEGANTLKISESQGRNILGTYIMWVTALYEALYRAKDDALVFHTAALTGDTSICVTGLTRKDLYLFDVTDPAVPVLRNVSDNLFTDTGNGYVFSFRETLSSQKRFVLTPLDGMRDIAAEDITAGQANSIIGNPLEGGVDVLVVCHPSYLDEMQPWVDYRRAQGYKLLIADVGDIYDEFNNGVPNPRGIKRFIEHFFELGNASFVVLVGDASEDNKNVHPQSPLNFIPSESFPESVGGEFEDEVVTSDKWYVLMNNDFLPGQGDYLPDLIIGRLPVGSGLEAQILLNKIFAYEHPTAADFWRLRMILVADDAWSASGFNICYKSGETGFEDGMQETAGIIQDSPCGGYDLVRFYLSDYTYEVHPPTGPCVSPTNTIFAVRAGATLDLLRELSAGATLVSIQSHMNRYQVTHEWLLTSAKTTPTGGSNGRDHAKVNNAGKPFVIFGLGCHFSDYALHKEQSLTNQAFNDANGDCFAELLLFQNNKGAVATYGSSGFEYLSPNRSFNNIIFDTYFTSPPQDKMVASDRAQVRWIFGEVMTLGELRYGASGPIKRYHILGDPLLRIDAGPPRFDVAVNGA
ncbi:MAG: C25 family cysteine peptidase, partial [Candidatus Latescibacterota bacterium]